VNDGDATRQVILNLLQQHPGLHKSELARALGLGWGTISYHLQVLCQTGAVQQMRRGRRLRLFPGGMDEKQMRLLCAMRQDVQNDILKALTFSPGAAAESLADELGLSRRLIRRHLASLEEDGIVDALHVPRTDVTNLRQGLEPYHR
jgi:predicted transcriptional regulator